MPYFIHKRKYKILWYNSKKNRTMKLSLIAMFASVLIMDTQAAYLGSSSGNREEPAVVAVADPVPATTTIVE